MATPKQLWSWISVAIVVLLVPSVATGRQPLSFDTLGVRYEREIRPLLSRFCLDCHSTESKEGELDLERFEDLVAVRQDTKAWQKVRQMVAQGEMPPEDGEQLSAEQRRQLQGWLQEYLHAEALSRAGDPGSIVLRRLNNAEYTYTVGDLTGIDLAPAREFPSDGAGGEGFTNVGNALAMSPSLLTKYLDAGKRIAAHVVLLPDGIRFSSSNMSGDWTNEIVAEIRELYEEFSDTFKLGIGTELGNVNVHEDIRIGLMGRLPLERYLSISCQVADLSAATQRQSDVFSVDITKVEDAAREHKLSAGYLHTLLSNLTATTPSFLLEGLRHRWQNAEPDQAAVLAAEVAGWQKTLWTFGPVGLIGRKGGRSRWMEPINPIVTQVELRHTVPPPAEGEDPAETFLEIVVTDAGDGNDQDIVLFHQPRLVAEGQPDILLRDLFQTESQAKDAPATDGPVRAAWHHTSPVVLRASMFGRHPDGREIDSDSLCIRAPAVVQIRLPAVAAAGRKFVATASLDPASGAEGSVQVLYVVRGVHDAPVIRSGLFTSELSVRFSKVTNVFADHQEVTFRGAVLVGEDSAARRRVEAGMDEYRHLFPAALCYTQIMPVDEVITVHTFYREDDHLSRLMLDDARRARLDRLWNQLYYIGRSPLKELDTLKLQLEVVTGNSQYDSIVALSEPLNRRGDEFRQELVDSEPRHWAALVDFAARAYRGRMTERDANKLRELYRRFRELEMSHEEAFRLTLSRVFVASPFMYRLEDVPEGSEPAVVSDWELANRLSYFLWSSMPDTELGAAADEDRFTRGRRRSGVPVAGEESLASGNGFKDGELLRQTRRMLRDPRVRRLATEFVCQYLHIHGFDPLVEKSEKLFPEFADLRGDMYEETILLFTDLFQNDLSLLNMLNADHTFLNNRLAKFYGMEGVEGPAWRRQDGVQQHGRGGILALAATLAQQSGATRTSPILRGNWVSEVLLGEKLPRPPLNVPQLSAKVPEGLTERQLIERHSSDASCAKCHERIDPFGFALENYDAIGRRRETSASGGRIDARTTLPDGTGIEGISGLREYLLEERRDQFIRQFCRKLLGYALGREVQLSDQPLLDDIMKELAANDYRVSVVVERIVLSHQFRTKQGRLLHP